MAVAAGQMFGGAAVAEGGVGVAELDVTDVFNADALEEFLGFAGGAVHLVEVTGIVDAFQVWVIGAVEDAEKMVFFVEDEDGFDFEAGEDGVVGGDFGGFAESFGEGVDGLVDGLAAKPAAGPQADAFAAEFFCELNAVAKLAEPALAGYGIWIKRAVGAELDGKYVETILIIKPAEAGDAFLVGGVRVAAGGPVADEFDAVEFVAGGEVEDFPDGIIFFVFAGAGLEAVEADGGFEGGFFGSGIGGAGEEGKGRDCGEGFYGGAAGECHGVEFGRFGVSRQNGNASAFESSSSAAAVQNAGASFERPRDFSCRCVRFGVC